MLSLRSLLLLVAAMAVAQIAVVEAGSIKSRGASNFIRIACNL